MFLDTSPCVESLRSIASFSASSSEQRSCNIFHIFSVGLEVAGALGGGTVFLARVRLRHGRIEVLFAGAAMFLEVRPVCLAAGEVDCKARMINSWEPWLKP